jgi:hypothetical protein
MIGQCEELDWSKTKNEFVKHQIVIDGLPVGHHKIEVDIFQIIVRLMND